MKLSDEPLSSEEAEETETFLDAPSSPTRADSRLRGRIMRAGYRYKLLEESQTGDGGPGRSTCCYSRALLVAMCVMGALFLAMLVLFLTVVVSNVSGQDCGKDKLCLTPGCVETSAGILKKMDTSVDPCKDIYRYACGGWMKETSIPPGQYKINMFSQAFQKGNEFLRKFLEDDSIEFKGHNSSSMSKLKTAYRGCMDKTSLEQVGTTRFVELINNLGSWTVVEGTNNISLWNRDQWVLQERIEASHNLWGSGLFTYGLSVDDKDTSHRILKFMQSGLSLAYPKLYSSSSNDSTKFENGFLEYATEVAVLLGGDAYSARSKMRKVYKLEKELAQIHVPKSELTNPLKTYHKMTLKDLQTLIGPWINLKRYLQNTFNGHQFPDTEMVLVSTPSYLRNLSSIVEKTDKEVLANYMMWNTLQLFIRYLTDDFHKAVLHLSKIETGITELPPRWKLCSSFANNAVGFVSSAVYVDKKFSASHKAKALEMGEKFRQEFMTNLDSVEWLDSITKERLRDKAKAIEFKIGYPDWILNPKELDKYYEKLEIQEGKLFDNKLAIIKFKTDRTIGKYGKKPDKTEWTEYPIMVNGYYSAKFNTIIMPAGILQPPFFDYNFPKSAMFSTIGMVVGHELTHAFDNSGRMYDKFGNLANLWTPAVSQMYSKHAQCIEDQYGNFTLQGEHANGKTTLNENIADNGALLLGYSAYMKDNKTHSFRLPGLDLTDNQLFFVGYAQAMCALYTPQYQVDSLTTDEHSFPEFRVKGVFANMPMFYEAFNCPKPSSSDMCQVW